METQIDNKYKTQFYNENGTDAPVPTFTAEDLLKMMRKEIEPILLATGNSSPPSQTVRAKRAIELLEAQSRKLWDERKNVMCPEINMDQMSTVSRMIKTLQDFLAVNRTVWILEGRPL